MNNKRNTILAMIISSFLGGVIAIGGYSIIAPDSNNMVVPTGSDANPVSFTNYNYVFDSADFVVPEGLNFVYAAKAATPAVVHIRTTYSAEVSQYHNPIQEFFRDYYGDRGQRTPRERQGAGSGVIVSPDGYIATNNHVIEESSEIEVVLSDNRSFEAEIIGTDPDTDIALIKIKAENLPTVAFGNSESIQVGEWVLAIGNPFAFRSTVTAGIVSAKGRNIGILGRESNTQIESFIQTDAAVNPGNSGGALVNLKGELVGINTAIASPTGAFAGYSFAVPTTLVKKVVADLKDFGSVQRPLLGIGIKDMNATLAKEHNAEVLRGVYVDGVNPNSAAEEAGIKKNDVIVAIDDKPITNVAQLQEQVALNRPGDVINVTYIRDGKTYTTKAKLKNIFDSTQIVSSSSAIEIEGARLAPVGDRTKQDLGIDGGVQINSLGEGKWKQAGIKEKFIITKIDKRDIRTPEDLSAALRGAQGEGILIEGLYPNGEKAYYGIGW